MKQEPGRQQPGISGLQAGEDVNDQSLTQVLSDENAVALRRDKYWLHVREAGRQSRRDFTDQLKAFCAYVDPQGDASSDPEAAFMRLTTALYTPLGLTGKVIHKLREAKTLNVLRDRMTPRVLFALSVLEEDLAAYLKEAMKRGELRSTIKAHMRAEAKRMAAFCGIAPKAARVKEAA